MLCSCWWTLCLIRHVILPIPSAGIDVVCILLTQQSIAQGEMRRGDSLHVSQLFAAAYIGCTSAWDTAIRRFSPISPSLAQNHCSCCYKKENFWWIREGEAKTRVWYSSGFLHCSTLHYCFSREDQTLRFVSCYIKKLYTGRYSFSNSTGSDLKPQNYLGLLWVNCKLFPAPLTMWQLSQHS